jgi:DNA-directed RNA polymerase sigma subunit (sigma70/sigma32)
MTEQLRNDLFIRMLPLAQKATSRFTISGYEPCDLKSEAALILFELLDSGKDNQGHDLTEGYLITAVKNRLKNLKKRARFLDLVSLDQPIGEDEGGDMTLNDVVADSKAVDPEVFAVAANLADHVLAQFNQLPQLERQIVALRLGLDLDDNDTRSFRVVGERFQMSDDRAARLYRSSITKLSLAIQ